MFFLFASSRPSRLPAHHRGLVEGHEVDLTRRATFCTAEEYFVVAFAQEFKALRFLVHENAVQVTRLDGTYLWGVESQTSSPSNLARISPQSLYCPIP
jgi:hypothetical protein